MIKIKLSSAYKSELKKAEIKGYKTGYIEACESIRLNSEKNLKNTLQELEKYKINIKGLRDEINSLNSILLSKNNILENYKDSEIECLFAIMKKCKKARVKTKYKNKILKLVSKRLIERGFKLNE